MLLSIRSQPSVQARAKSFRGRSVVLLLAQLSDAAWVKVCTENDRLGLIPLVFLHLSRLLLMTNGNNFFSAPPPNQYWTSTTSVRIICIYCFCINIPINQFQMEVLRSMMGLFVCFTEKIIYPEWQ